MGKYDTEPFPIYTSVNMGIIVMEIISELIDAKAKHPDWPTDLIHQIAIMSEESGEAVRAALNHVYHGEDISELRKELIQTAAMCIRCLEQMEE